MNSINRYFIDDVLGPLVGLADSPADVELYENIDRNDEVQVKELFNEIIKPDFEAKRDVVKIKTKNALSFYLASNKMDFTKIFHSNLLPIMTPVNMKLFFIWLWEVLFKNERFDNIDLNKFYEKNDPEEPWRILLK